MEPLIPLDWVENPPEDIETQALILDRYTDQIKAKTPTGDTLRYILDRARRAHAHATEVIHENEPQAFWQPSYEQALLLNAWIWGINFPICFSANRIGKTAAMAFNGILWIFPNNPQWTCFQPTTDYLNRKVQVVPRPPLQNLLKIQAHLQRHPDLMGDPYHQPYEDCNVAKFNELFRQIPDLYQPAYPYPPIQVGGQIWLGAPDNDFHKRIIMRLWRRLLPKASILKDSESDRMFIISTQSTTNPKTTAHELVCKSYESEDTKWSGDAVHGIILTEGFEQDTLDEIKNRVTNEAFASWDYTPADPRNTGKKVALAYRVYKKEEELPLRSFTYIGFSVRTAPEHILPKEKKQDLIRMWDNRPAGKARLDGDFFSSSGLVLDALDRDFHCLDWEEDELFTRYPGGRFYRGLDPGFDHPTACVWGYLSTNNIWFIYRVYSRRGTTISQRCQDIIALSYNQREKTTTKGGQTIWRETHPNPNSELIVATPTDYHTFKQDEVTGVPYANQYISEGLVITESTHMGPEERATKTNSMLDPNANPHIAHPKTNKAPGARIFFLTRGKGVANMLDKFDQLFWDRYKAGDLRGEPKDKVPLHGDDELDALCNLTCGPYVWTAYQPKRREPETPEETFSPSVPPNSLDFERLKRELALEAAQTPQGFR
jgi:hypothetical protein